MNGLIPVSKVPVIHDPDTLTYVLEIDKSIANAGCVSLIPPWSLEIASVIIILAVVGEILNQSLVKSKITVEKVHIPIRKYMKSYLPRLVSSTISLSIDLQHVRFRKSKLQGWLTWSILFGILRSIIYHHHLAYFKAEIRHLPSYGRLSPDESDQPQQHYGVPKNNHGYDVQLIFLRTSAAEDSVLNELVALIAPARPLQG